MNFRHIAFIIVPGIALMAVSAILQLWYWLGFWVVTFAWLGFVEWLSYKLDKKTLSRKIWESERKWIYIAFLITFMVFLVLHLAT